MATARSGRCGRVLRSGRAARMRTLAVGYRLAPEHAFPAAHQDALAAWRFLRSQRIAAGAIAVGGDSAIAVIAAIVSLWPCLSSACSM
jgi:acetyl esterase/lipase